MHNAFSEVAKTPEKTCCFLYFVQLKGFSVICKSLKKNTPNIFVVIKTVFSNE